MHPQFPLTRFGISIKLRSRKIMGLRRAIAIPGIALLALLSLTLVGFKFTAIEDKIDYPFINDQQVIGKWQTVDFVEKIDDFSPGQKSYAK